jgi:hypothetical protein
MDGAVRIAMMTRFQHRDGRLELMAVKFFGSDLTYQT